MIGGYVRLPTIMSKLLSNNGSQVFGDFKLIIMGMLGSYGFEKRILVSYLILIKPLHLAYKVVSNLPVSRYRKLDVFTFHLADNFSSI